MKSKNTSPSCNKTNAIMLSACGRVGTNFILSTIRSNFKEWFCLGEFFNHIFWNMYIKTKVVQLMAAHKSNYIYKYAGWLDAHQQFLIRNLSGLVREYHSMPIEKLIEEMERFIEPSNEELYEVSVKFLNKTMNKNTIAKVFLSQTSLEETDRMNNNIDINRILKHCNALIIPHRKSALLTHISEVKGNLNNVWYVDTNEKNMDRIEECKKLKVTWDKEAYLGKLNQIKNAQEKITEIYNNFDKPKCIINYEALHAQKNKLQYLQEVYDQNGINITIKPEEIDHVTIKQSKEQPLEDNFNNPEEFLKDFPNIQTEIPIG
jgi:hypothetical protein